MSNDWQTGSDKPVGESDAAHLTLLVPDIVALPAQDDVEVHAVDTDGGVVLDSQIDVLLDAEAEVAVLAEVVATQLVLADLEAALQNLLGLGTTDCAVNGDLLVTTDAEGPDGVSRLGEDGSLAGQRLQDLGGPGQAIAGLADANVQAELADPGVPHGVLGLLFGNHSVNKEEEIRCYDDVRTLKIGTETLLDKISTTRLTSCVTECGKSKEWTNFGNRKSLK